jgi:hypothetical protein
MKENNNLSHSLTILLSAGLLVVCGFTATAEAKSHRTVNGSNASTQSAEQPGRLIIHRLPNLGVNVIVDLYVDGAPFGSVGYGQTLDRNLSPGRHVLSVEATPRPTYATRSNATVDVQSGETYTFTAEDNGSGNLVLK